MRAILAIICVMLLASTAAALTPTSYMVFFSRGSSAINEQDDKTIENVASVFRQKTNARVVIAAHTDGEEAQALSSDLSPARGEAVKRRLVAFGVPADRIEISAFGDSRGLVQHLTGAVEPQNRRVELFVMY
jgi:OOP family OmpA-OmpF porin